MSLPKVGAIHESPVFLFCGLLQAIHESPVFLFCSLLQAIHESPLWVQTSMCEVARFLSANACYTATECYYKHYNADNEHGNGEPKHRPDQYRHRYKHCSSTPRKKRYMNFITRKAPYGVGYRHAQAYGKSAYKAYGSRYTNYEKY